MGFSATSETETETPPPLQSKSAKSHLPLHNFSFPLLKWDNQSFLCCMKGDSTSDRGASQFNGFAPSPTRPPLPAVRMTSAPASMEKLRTPPRKVAAKPDGDSTADDAAIEEIRGRLLDHLRSAADKMRFPIPEEAEEPPPAPPWNLRKRPPARKSASEIDAIMPPLPPPVVEENQVRSMRSKTVAVASNAAVQGKEKGKLTVALLKEDIDEDFVAMTGSRAARRPKKRSGRVQRQLDLTFPGLWLSNITVETYRVTESHEKRKG